MEKRFDEKGYEVVIRYYVYLHSLNLMEKILYIFLELTVICILHLMFINSDIASYSIKKDALVLTSDSDFLVYDLKGVILLPRNFFREDLYVYTRTKILDFLGFQEFQLHYYIMISGNDYTKHHPSKLRDGREATVENTLDYIREVCKSQRECKEDYEEMYPDDDAMEEFEMLEKLYSCKQVEIPWNCLTTDIDRVDEIKTKIPEGFDVSTK